MTDIEQLPVPADILAKAKDIFIRFVESGKGTEDSIYLSDNFDLLVWIGGDYRPHATIFQVVQGETVYDREYRLA